MSNSPKSRNGAAQAQPKAIIHKQILDAAAESPEASMAELADSVSGASTSLVEQVLDRYGDPSVEADAPSGDGTAGPDDGDGEADGADGAGGDGDSDDADSRDADTDGDVDSGDGDADDGDGETDRTADAAAGTGEDTDAGSREPGDDGEPDALSPEALSPKQRRVLRAVADDPGATQRELADRLGVSTATISNRVNAVEGFDWSSRASLVEALFDADDDDEAPDAGGGSGDATPSKADGGTAPDGDAAADAADRGADDRDAADRDANDADAGTVTDGDAGGRDIDRVDGDDEGGTRTEARADTVDEPGEPDDGAAERDGTDASGEVAALAETVAALSGRVEALTARLDELEAASAADSSDESVGGSGRGPLADPELAHKVVHACVRSDAVTEAEELRVVEAVVAPDGDE